jgi:hypothetical protein
MQYIICSLSLLPLDEGPVDSGIRGIPKTFQMLSHDKTQIAQRITHNLVRDRKQQQQDWSKIRAEHIYRK